MQKGHINRRTVLDSETELVDPIRSLWLAVTGRDVSAAGRFIGVVYLVEDSLLVVDVLSERSAS